MPCSTKLRSKSPKDIALGFCKRAVSSSRLASNLVNNLGPLPVNDEHSEVSDDLLESTKYDLRPTISRYASGMVACIAWPSK